jgi:DNA topoisomerase-1
VEREKEIRAFLKGTYFTIDGVFIPALAKEEVLSAKLLKKDGVPYEKSTTITLFDGTYTSKSSSILSEDQAQTIMRDIQSPFTVSAVEKKEVRRSPPAPFTTSTLQQDSGRKLSFSAKKTMQIAQKLYEVGYITYHRTDSVNLSEKFLTEAREYIAKTYGERYLPEKKRTFQTKSKVAQEAHEAIRPTTIGMTGENFEVPSDMNHDHVRLYELIWKRAVGSQAKEAVFDSTTIEITSRNGYVFGAQGSVIQFDGYLKIIGREVDEIVLPSCTVGEIVTLKSLEKASHESSPPPRYTEASLIKALEEKDIGRPSTYAPIISTIQERLYVVKQEKKLVPTELGFLVTDFLVKYFSHIMDLPFTAKMEAFLEDIANGAPWVPVIRAFYDPFMVDMKTAEKLAPTLAEESLDEKCPTCEGALVFRTSKYGKFIACSTFPACKYTRQIVEKIDKKCPKCGADIVVKKTRTGKTFFGCGNYPACTFAAWKKEDIK